MFVGIDPGASGALASVSSEVTQSGTLAELFQRACAAGTGDCWGVSDVPTVTRTVGKQKRRKLDERVAMDWLVAIAPHVRLLVLEEQRPMAGQGVVSMFTIGHQFGWWQGALQALAIPHQVVRPQDWKRVMLAGTAKDKQAARDVASRLFPSADLGTRKDQGRSDALLLAEYGRRLVSGGTSDG